VNSLMRRTILLALLASLLLAPAASAQSDKTIEIQRDCVEDSVLQGDYTVAQLRKAKQELPTDGDEYSDCRDVLTRAISAAIADSKPSPTPAANNDGGSGSGGTGSGSSGGDTGGGSESTARSEREQAALSAPSSPQDAEAVNSAYADGDKAIQVELDPQSPGQARLAASVGRNGLPTTMIAVLALLAATFVAACLPLLRRHRGFPNRRA
jgi:hypothetical protein